MGENIEKAKVEEKKADVAKVDESCPIFRVEQGPGFTTGVQTYAPGEFVRWEAPEGWDEKKYGRHFSSYGPSVTFTPMNEKAKKLMVDHVAKLKARHAPKPDVNEKLLEAIQKQSERQEQTLELLTKLVAKLVEKK